MRNLKRFGAWAVALVVIAVLAVPAQAGEYTVGQFIQRLAMTKSLNATDADTAARSLAASGIRIPSDVNYSDALTEGHVARLALAAGLKVRTASPDAIFDETNVDRFFASFKSELRKPGNREADQAAQDGVLKSHFPNGNGNGFGHGKGKGKGKGKGLNVTPTDIE